MPSASAELQDQMMQKFGSLDDAGPRETLEKAGYHLSEDWLWSGKEDAPTIYEMPRDEFELLLFLIHEHDYGIAPEFSQRTPSRRSSGQKI